MTERKRCLRSVLGGAIVLPLVLVLTGCNGWSMFGFGATHSAFSSAETVIGTGNVGSLFESGTTAPTSGPISSSPTIAKNVLYVTSQGVGGASPGTLSAYAADGSTNCSTATPRTCTPLWTATPARSHGLSSTPAVDTAQGVVYVGSANGELYAYDAGGNSGCATGTNGAKVCNPLWHSDLLGGSIDSSPALADGYVYISTVYGAMYMFPETTGYDHKNPSCASNRDGLVCHWEWADRTPGDVLSSPAVSNGRVYTASTGSQGLGRLWAFDATTDNSPNCTGTRFIDKTCSPQWTAARNSGKSSPVVVNGVVYIGSLLDGLLAFAADGSANCSGTQYAGRTCSPLWTGTTDRQEESTPAVADGVVYIGARNGDLYAFNATNGTPQWTASTAGPIDSSPAFANGVVYVGCSNELSTCPGNLYAFNATNGSPLWTGTTSATDGSIDTSPIVADVAPIASDVASTSSAGAVYVGSGNRTYGFALF